MFCACVFLPSFASIISHAWHLLHVLQAIHFGLAFRLIRKLGMAPNCSWECLNSHEFPKCLSTMCKEVRGIAGHRFLCFLVEKGSKKANELEGSITFPESNGMKTSKMDRLKEHSAGFYISIIGSLSQFLSQRRRSR